MSKRALFIVLMIVVIGGALAAVLFQRMNTVSYDLTTAQRGDIAQEVLASGKIESPTNINLRFKNSERLVALNVVVGQKVIAGEVLAVQDSSVLDIQLRQLRSVLQSQEYRLESRKKNTIADYNDAYDIKTLETIVDQARADIEIQRLSIAEMILVAPVDGVIVAVNNEIGEIVGQESAVISMISGESLRINVDVPETTIANIEIGQAVKITLDAFEDSTEWSGSVVKIDSAETIKGGAVYYETTVSFDAKDLRIKPGMTANVWIKTATSKDVLLIPVSAVRKKDGKKIVQVLRDTAVVEKEVSVGLKNNAGMIEIISGLSLGEQVILGTKQ